MSKPNESTSSTNKSNEIRCFKSKLIILFQKNVRVSDFTSLDVGFVTIHDLNDKLSRVILQAGKLTAQTIVHPVRALSAIEDNLAPSGVVGPSVYVSGEKGWWVGRRGGEQTEREREQHGERFIGSMSEIEMNRSTAKRRQQVRARGRELGKRWET